MRISLMLLLLASTIPVDAAQAGPAPYYVDKGSWTCGSPGNLLGGHMTDQGADCIPPIAQQPTNVVVMGLFGQFAYFCEPLDAPGLSLRFPFCQYSLAESIVDRKGMHPNMATLKAYAARQTMRDVMAIK